MDGLTLYNSDLVANKPQIAELPSFIRIMKFSAILVLALAVATTASPLIVPHEELCSEKSAPGQCTFGSYFNVCSRSPIREGGAPLPMHLARKAYGPANGAQSVQS